MSKEAMKYLKPGAIVPVDVQTTALLVNALREALASQGEALAEQKSGIRQVIELYDSPDQPAQQEPVAWMMEGWGPDCGPYVEFYRHDEMGWRDRKEWTPLYTSPPASKPWVGLTDVEWMNIVNKDHAWFGQRPEDVAHEVAKLVEAKLREKNNA